MVGDLMIYFLSSVFFSHFTFTDLFFHFSFLQIKTISWLWFRIQQNKPLTWLPASFLNLIAPKYNSGNHVDRLAYGNYLRAHSGRSSDLRGLQPRPSRQSCPSAASVPEFPGGSFPPSLEQEPVRSLHPASSWPSVHFVTFGQGCFSLTKNSWNAYPAVCL